MSVLALSLDAPCPGIARIARRLPDCQPELLRLRSKTFPAVHPHPLSSTDFDFLCRQYSSNTPIFVINFSAPVLLKGFSRLLIYLAIATRCKILHFRNFRRQNGVLIGNASNFVKIRASGFRETHPQIGDVWPHFLRIIIIQIADIHLLLEKGFLSIYAPVGEHYWNEFVQLLSCKSC